MSLLSILNRTKPLHIVIPGLALVAMNLLVNFYYTESEMLRVFNAVFGFVYSFFACLSVFLIYRVSKKILSHFNRTLLWLLLTMLAWMAGDALYIFFIVYKIEPFISPIDIFYLSATLFLIVAVLTIPGSQPPSYRRRMVFVEMSILVLSATVFFTSLLLLRGTPDLTSDVLTLLMTFIYPVLDIILLWVIMVLFFTYPDKNIQKVLSFIIAGAVSIFISDFLYLVNSIYVPLARDFLVDTGYYIFYIFLLLAGLSGFKHFRTYPLTSQEKVNDFNSGRWIVFLPGVFLVIVIGLMLVFVLNQSFILPQGILALIVVIILLFLIHQYLVISDNIKLTSEMREINTRLENKVELRTAELSQANLELQSEMKVREKAEHDLARINQDLALLNKDKDRLFTILAHDLRSPLGSMMKLSELLAENIKDFDENELLEVITALNKSSIQTFQLLNDLLAWSAVQMGKGITVKEHFLLADVVNESITSVAQDADTKNIRVQSGINPEIIVFADKFAIMTVIRNLLSNAVKFTGHEGCVDVRADQETGVVKISVTDNGLGISKEKQEKIFRVDSLSSTPGTDGEKGTGFGLLLCKDLVQKNDGEIWLESETGKGSTFFISLPSDKRESLDATKPNLNSEGRIELRYDHARKLGFSTFIGEFNFSLFNSELHRIWSSPDYKPAYSILIDVRQASISSENKDFKEIISLFRNMPGTGTKKKFALLTTTPQQVAYSTIFGQDMMSKYPFEIEVFSTTEAALKWLV